MVTDTLKVMKQVIQDFRSVSTQPKFQRRIDLVSTLRINLEITMMKMKQNRNPTSDFQRCTTLTQRQCRCPTLKQRSYNVISTLFQRSLSTSKSYIETNWASVKCGFVNR